MKQIKPKKLTDDNFKPFGTALKKPDKELDIESHWLRYWHNTVDLSNLGSLGMMGFMQVKRVPILCQSLLVLFNSIEMYISLDGKPCVVFVAPSISGDCHNVFKAVYIWRVLKYNSSCILLIQQLACFGCIVTSNAQ